MQESFLGSSYLPRVTKVKARVGVRGDDVRLSQVIVKLQMVLIEKVQCGTWGSERQPMSYSWT